MTLPTQIHIFRRNSTYYFRRRIPLELLPHYSPKTEFVFSLKTKDLREAERLGRIESVRIDAEFEQLKAIHARLPSVSEPSSSITLESMQAIVDKMVHSKIAEDASMRSKGYYRDANYKARALAKLSSDEQIVNRAISEGDYEDLAESIHSWLRGHGFAIPTDSSAFRTFAELYAEGMSKVNTTIRDRNKGEIVDTPEPPRLNTVARPSANPMDSLEQLRDYWLTQSKRSRTAQAEATTMIRKFRDFVGDLKPSEIRKTHVVELKDKMLEAGSSPATINKGRGILAAIFSCAEKNAKIDSNPFYNMDKLKVPNKEVDSPYTIEELKTIFNSPVFKDGLRPKQGKGEAAYWMPLIGLYTGCRLNEIAQIFLEDVGEEDGIHYIIIRPDETTGRTVKDSNKRRIPIHPDLIKMGFLKYLAQMRQEKQTQLFPELKVARVGGKLGDKWGSWWRSYVRDELKIARVPSPFHGLRHAFTEHGRRCEMSYEARMRIEGHALNTVGDKSYGNALFPLEPLYKEIQKLSFKGLDLSHLYKS